MAMKNTVEVVIAGKVFKISGFESAEYLHQVSVYINEKLAEFQKMEGYRRQTSDQKQLMLNMNLADDFFKAKRQADKLAAELEKKEREMYGIRHELVEAQLLLEKRDTKDRESAEKLEAQKKALEKERQDLKKTVESQQKALENQKKALEGQRQSSQKKLEEQNQGAQKRLAEQKRNYESEIERLQKEIRDLQRTVGRLEEQTGSRSGSYYQGNS